MNNQPEPKNDSEKASVSAAEGASPADPDRVYLSKGTRNSAPGTVYRHQARPGPGSRMIQLFLGLSGMKRVILKKLINRDHGISAASIPGSLLNKCQLSVDHCRQRQVWTLSPKNSASDTVVLFLHGGAYYGNMSRIHWRLVEKLLDGTWATFIVPDYPLAPGSVCEDTYRFLDAVRAELLSRHHAKRLVFMGDSAGGGLALGFAQKIRNEAGRQPAEIILFSPWLDASMSNPDLARFDRNDKILSIKELKIAGKTYSGDLEVTDFRVSPVYGDLAGLGRISIFTGTNDILFADALKLRQRMQEQHIDLKYYEYPGMFHDWVLVPGLRETKDVIAKVVAFPVFGAPQE